MDWTTIISSVLAFAAGGGLTTVFLLREIKRAKKIENDKAIADEWKSLFEGAKEDIKEHDAKLDTQGSKLDKVFDALHCKEAECAGLEVKLARLELLRCDKTPCSDRQPPFGGGSLPETINKK